MAEEGKPETVATEVEKVPEKIAEPAAEVVDESEDLVELISDRTAGKLEERIKPLSDRVTALEQRGEAKVASVETPAAAVEKAVTEKEPPLVKPKRKHWSEKLPRGIF